jgi:hypothetical protein
MKFCLRCDGAHWVCENHPGKPWLGDRACDCGCAGMPCPICNQTDEGEFPSLPEGFVPEVIKKKLP